ncbi:barwin-like endoglucanase [Decorospora gaudefroyi]|uniref:Barwin-like endoglucanase n=1 Tax=Decorospora gaudefroyi TaxID=184978 RepID=A0A6A5KS28_9PLEO|nr:barwin-like endoglucanase [Decorospora gaudefroyi]
MKSVIFSLLPIVGLAVAESICTRQTVTKTAYETVYETVKAADVTNKQVADLTSKSATCTSRSTVTTTSYEKVYVTVTPEAAAAAVDVTSTSSLHIYTTVTVRPSEGYSASDSTSAIYSAKSPAASTYASAAPSASAVVDTTSANSKRGEATFYGGNVSGGMCSFTGYTIPSGIYGTALSDSNWGNAANCGACVSVTGPSGTKVTAMIVDQCPGCGTNHLDLFPDAFAKLANPSAGIIDVSWDFVPCGIKTPIVLKNKEGTSKYWFSMQVMNSNVPVAKLEVSTDGGRTWQPTTRKDYNYFENPAGFGTDSVDVKVTSKSGGSIVVKGVSIAANSKKTAGSNFSS